MSAPAVDAHVRRSLRQKLRTSVTVFAVLLALVGAGPVAYLWWPVWQIADVGEPFDIHEFDSVSVGPENNAFTDYRAAQARLIDLGAFLKNDHKRWEAVTASEEEVLQQGWSAANDDLRGWLEINREALQLWKRGTERPDALEVPLADLKLDVQLPVTQSVTVLARLALLEAARLTGEKRTADAWSWYQAALRASRHLCFHGCVIQRIVACAAQTRTVDPVLRWSSSSQVQAADLRVALAEVIAIDRLTPPVSTNLKIEYLSLRNSPGRCPEACAQEWFLEAMGTPERYRLMSKVLLANWLSQCDRPRFGRSPVQCEEPLIFGLDAQGTRLRRHVSPKAIQDWSSALENHWKWMFGTVPLSGLFPQGAMMLAVDREEVHRSAAILGLTLQLFHRELGEFPVSLDELVTAGYLNTIPADPFGKGEPLHYRRDARTRQGATLWSVWLDGLDQDGRLEWSQQNYKSSGDKIFRIAAPPATRETGAK